MRAYPSFMFAVSATSPLCFCGSHTLARDRKFQLRCERGHFAKPLGFVQGKWAA